MSEVKKFVLVPKELWETRKKKLSVPSCEIYKKEETVFPVIKKAKEEVSSENPIVRLKNLRPFPNVLKFPVVFLCIFGNCF